MARCDSYTFGNCTAGACALAPWIPDGLGDGGDWAADYAARGGQVVQYPVPGSVVSYCRGDGYSQFGHVAYVEQVSPSGLFLVKEMNFVEFDAYDERWSNMGDVCGFLLPPPGFPGSGAPQVGPGPGGSADDARLAWEDLRSWFNGDAEGYMARLQNVTNLLNGI